MNEDEIIYRAPYTEEKFTKLDNAITFLFKNLV